MTSLVNPSELFPLANHISLTIEDSLPALETGATDEFTQQLTPVTQELLRWWFSDDFTTLREQNFHRGQRDAILAIIYAHEVLNTANLQELYEALTPSALLSQPGLLSELTEERNKYRKYAAKMATGTGKTWVLNALLIWQYLNHRANPADPRFTANFLIIAPGLIVYDRLLDSFLGKRVPEENRREFTSSDIYSNRELFVPNQHRDSVFAFVQSSTVEKHSIGKKLTGGGVIAITNWHLLAGKEDKNFTEELEEENSLVAAGQDIDGKAAAASFIPLTPGTASGNTLDTRDAAYQRGRQMQWLKDLPRLIVFNDEAHHIHAHGTSGEVEWQKSLTSLAQSKDPGLFTQIDFSATPYTEVRGKKRYFPHIVTDFELMAAMRAGLVKSLALDKRSEVAALANDDLDFSAERNERGQVIGLSNGQRVMINAGLGRLRILEEQFAILDPEKHPKLMIMVEDTSVSPLVVDYLLESGYAEEDILRVDSDRKGELGEKQWLPVRDKLFDIDAHKTPKIIVSVLMLREGFDVNNICVIVPLRSAKASILAEQTVGRGLRLMWRGEEYEEAKRENRERIAKRQEPSNYLDVLFIVEHPRFEDLYEELLGDGLITEVGDPNENTKPLGDLLRIELRDGYEEYDFSVPMIQRDADEELETPSIDVTGISPSKFPLDLLLKQIGKDDRFAAHDVEQKTRFGEYRVTGAPFTAAGYNEYLAKIATRIGGSFDRVFNRNGQMSVKPRAGAQVFLQVHRATLMGWIDDYIQLRLFGDIFDPFVDEQWRVLMNTDVIDEITRNIGTELVANLDKNIEVSKAEVLYRTVSEVSAIQVREGSSLEVTKSIYPRLPLAAKYSGLERAFMQMADLDSKVQAFIKIHEHRHTYLQRPYIKDNGMAALYSPDFLVRTADSVYVVETKAQNMLSDSNVQRKLQAAVSWLQNINLLDPSQRDNRNWHYVLLGEQKFYQWRDGNGSLAELLDQAKVYIASQEDEHLF